MYEARLVPGRGRTDLQSSRSVVIGLIIDVPPAAGRSAATTPGIEPVRVSVVEQRVAPATAFSFEGECGCPDDCPRDHGNE